MEPWSGAASEETPEPAAVSDVSLANIQKLACRASTVAQRSKLPPVTLAPPIGALV